jgi:hypothetical protein
MNQQQKMSPGEEAPIKNLENESDCFFKVFASTLSITLIFTITIFKSYLEKPWQRWQTFNAVKAGQTAEVEKLLVDSHQSREDLINVAIVNGRLETLAFLLTTEPEPDPEKTRLMMEKAIDSFRPEVLKLWLKSWAKDQSNAEKWAGSMLYRAAAGNYGYLSAPDEASRRSDVIKQLIEINAFSELTEEDRQKILAESRFAEVKSLFEKQTGEDNE